MMNLLEFLIILFSEFMGPRQPNTPVSDIFESHFPLDSRGDGILLIQKHHHCCSLFSTLKHNPTGLSSPHQLNLFTSLTIRIPSGLLIGSGKRSTSLKPRKKNMFSPRLPSQVLISISFAPFSCTREITALVILPQNPSPR